MSRNRKRQRKHHSPQSQGHHRHHQQKDIVRKDREKIDDVQQGVVIIAIIATGFWGLLKHHGSDLDIDLKNTNDIVHDTREDKYSPSRAKEYNRLLHGVALPKLKPLLLERKGTVWGTFMPHLYFSFTTRTEHSPYIGLILKENGKWYDSCSMDVETYMWKRHDGRNFGEQEIVTKNYIILTAFWRSTEAGGNAWEVRITSTRKNNTEKVYPIELYLLIVDLHADTAKYSLTDDHETPYSVYFRTKELGELFIREFSTGDGMQFDFWRIFANSTIMSGLLLEPWERRYAETELYNGFISQYTSSKEMTVSLHISNLPTTYHLSKEGFAELMEKRLNTFDKRFDKVFPISLDEFSVEDSNVAKVMLSNLLGGIAFFPGSIQVHTKDSFEILQFSEDPIIVSTASRERLLKNASYAWDDGFRNIVIAMWDFKISLDIICHWLDLLDHQGWIPHEQIIDEFLHSSKDINYIPSVMKLMHSPIITFPLLQVVQRLVLDEKYSSREMLIKTIFQRMIFWFSNLVRYNFTSGYQLWSNSLDTESFIEDDKDNDDFDKIVWMAFTAQEIYRLSFFINDSFKLDGYFTSKNNNSIDLLQLYLTHLNKGSRHNFQFNTSEGRLYMKTEKSNPRNILLFLLQLIKPDSSEMTEFLTDLENPKKFWTPFGIRSPVHVNHVNEEAFVSEYRGSVQVKINYLALRALITYAEQSKRHSGKLKGLYKSLRTNVVRNVLKAYKEQGALYETYNDLNGKGEGHYPYTGSNALIVLIMSEKYH